MDFLLQDEAETLCPLCMEEMDFTDRLFQPCKCGYQTCLWCWHQIMELAAKNDSEGRCPACRTPYDKDQIPSAAPEIDELSEVTGERRLKGATRKARVLDSRKHLSNVRVVQRNLVYVVGLPLSLAGEALLERRDYFGQYGKIMKIAVSRSTSYNAPHSANGPTASVYVTYYRDEDAVRCIQAIDGCTLEGKVLRACFGTTKYCNAWLKNMACNNAECLYLHEVGTEADSFTKEQMLAKIGSSKHQSFHEITHQVPSKKGSLASGPSLADQEAASSASTSMDQAAAAATLPLPQAAQSAATMPAAAASISAATADMKTLGLPPAACWASKLPLKPTTHNGHHRASEEPTSSSEAPMPPHEPQSLVGTQRTASGHSEVSGSAPVPAQQSRDSSPHHGSYDKLSSSRLSQASVQPPASLSALNNGADASTKSLASQPGPKPGAAAAITAVPAIAHQQLVTAKGNLGQGLPSGTAAQASSSMPGVLPAGTTWASGDVGSSAVAGTGTEAGTGAGASTGDGTVVISSSRDAPGGLSEHVNGRSSAPRVANVTSVSRPSLGRPNSFAAAASIGLTAKPAFSSWSDRLSGNPAALPSGRRSELSQVVGTIAGSSPGFSSTTAGAVQGSNVPVSSAASSGGPQGGSYAAVAHGGAKAGKGGPRSAGSSPSRDGEARPSTAPGDMGGLKVRGSGPPPDTGACGLLGPRPAEADVDCPGDGGAAVAAPEAWPSDRSIPPSSHPFDSHSDSFAGIQPAPESGVVHLASGGPDAEHVESGASGSTQAPEGDGFGAVVAGAALIPAATLARTSAAAAAAAAATASVAAEAPAGTSGGLVRPFGQHDAIPFEAHEAAGRELGHREEGETAGARRQAAEDVSFLASILGLDGEFFDTAELLLPDDMAHMVSAPVEVPSHGGEKRAGGLAGLPATRHSRSRFHFARGDEEPDEAVQVPQSREGSRENGAPGAARQPDAGIPLAGSDTAAMTASGSSDEVMEAAAGGVAGAVLQGAQPGGDTSQQLGSVPRLSEQDGHAPGSSGFGKPPPGFPAKGPVAAAGLAAPPGFAAPLHRQSPQSRGVKPATSVPPGFWPPANALLSDGGGQTTPNSRPPNRSSIAARTPSAGDRAAAAPATKSWAASGEALAAPAAAQPAAEPIRLPRPVRLADIYQGGPAATFSELGRLTGADVEFIDPAIMAVGLHSLSSRTHGREDSSASVAGVASSLDSLFGAISLRSTAGLIPTAAQAAKGLQDRFVHDGGPGRAGSRAFPVTLQPALESSFQLHNGPSANSRKVLGNGPLEPLAWSNHVDDRNGETAGFGVTLAAPHTGQGGGVSFLEGTLSRPVSFANWLPANSQLSTLSAFSGDQGSNMRRMGGGADTVSAAADPMQHRPNLSPWSFPRPFEQSMPFAREWLLQREADDSRW